ncbi:YceI family protein [Roseovarius sp. 2305UL8-3]|uniref:YceI family protein n=1 Tax=Roseovarius conchicola TaxID=3121636 RepID=UPI003528BCFA
MSLARYAILAAFLAGPTLAETYHLDPTHTEVRFLYSHAGVSEQSGEWTRVDGTVDFDPADLAATSAEITIESGSLHTGVSPLDDYMKSSAFFDVDRFPEITFVSTSAEDIGEDRLRMTGDLTVKGQTMPITLEAELTFMGEHPLGSGFAYFKGDWIGVRVTGLLSRSALGLGTLPQLAGDEVTLRISSELRAGGW